jgi:Tfp pilus assembly protein PilF
MKKIITVGGLLLALAAFSGGTARAQTPDDIRIVALGGLRQVEVLPRGSTTWVLTQTNQTLNPFDRLRVGRDSSAAIAFAGKSAVRFDALTEIEILPSTASDDHGLNLLRGILSFFHRDQPGRIRVISSGGTAGIQGTEFVMSVLPANGVEQTTISVVDGDVHFANTAGVLEITNGQQAVAAPGVAPARTSGFIANNVLQWCFYYPGVLDLNDLAPAEKNFSGESAAAWRAGDLPAALATFSEKNSGANDEERLYHAALLLNNAQIAGAEKELAQVGTGSEKNQRLANALRMLIAAVRHETISSTATPQFATEFLAASYYAQSQPGPKSLTTALALAQKAVAVSPEFGFGWERVAELEFSFGRTDRAQAALDRALKISPQNAQALALKGFLLAAKNRTREAIAQFDRALASDSALGNAWLGRGLCRIRSGDLKGGREDLLLAAAMEPDRAALRSYLGKSFGDAGDVPRAFHELSLAKNLDTNDPTAWLYSALLNEQNNRVNEAVRDLEKSQELNNNRAVYRSPVLLDQDRAVRRANLARIYAEAGLEDVALREASRAVTADYANYSAHLFLANSYEQLRQANSFDQRFETPAFSEYLLASLLGPADGRMLAQPVTQQEYTHLFDRDSFGFSSDTEYLSRGAWSQYAAQYGTFGNSSYAAESSYHSDPGQTHNGSDESRQFSLKWKQILTPKDSLFLEVLDFHRNTGDLSQRYDPRQADVGLQVNEKQEPTLLAGLDHKWSETQHTLVLASYFNDSFNVKDPAGSTYLLADNPDGSRAAFFPTDLTEKVGSHLSVYSLEAQQIVHGDNLQTIAGLRLQYANNDLSNLQSINGKNAADLQDFFGNAGTVIARQSLRVVSDRVSPYIYEYWQVTDKLQLISGISYDYQVQPKNALFAPLDGGDKTLQRLSPKAAMIWTPDRHTTLRAAYARSLGGVDLDQSVRLEPSQLAGFVQTYRTLFPDSLVGGIAGEKHETMDASFEHTFPTRTYFALSGQCLRSTSDDAVGAFESTGEPDHRIVQVNRHLGFRELSLDADIHQLLGQWFSVGARYRISDARLTTTYPEISPALGPLNPLTLARIKPSQSGLLQQVSLEGVFRHPSGVFARTQATWYSQDLSDGLTGLPGDNFWQLNLQAGYRSPRQHFEFSLGLLNATGQNYHVSPINLYPDLQRQRTLAVQLKFNF